MSEDSIEYARKVRFAELTTRLRRPEQDFTVMVPEIIPEVTTKPACCIENMIQREDGRIIVTIAGINAPHEEIKRRLTQALTDNLY